MKAANVKFDYKENTLNFEIIGDIDHHTAKAVREEMDKQIFLFRAKNVIINLKNVDFMDSSGIGLILGRYTKIKEYGGVLKLSGVSGTTQRIIRLSGMDRIIEIN